MHVNYDGRLGTAGGAEFGAALMAAANVVGLDDPAALAERAGLEPATVAAVVRGEQRATPAMLARFAQAVRLRPIEFMQKTQLLSLDVYAAGLDPLFFLPPGPTRFDARIYMREINPRHAVPERDMTSRNPVLRALAEDTVIDDQLGRLELELTYLLRSASRVNGGSL